MTQELKTITANQALTEIRESVEKIKNDAPQRFPEAASPGDGFRQGDLYIKKLQGIPEGFQKAKSPRLKLVPGNSRGSMHCLDSLDGVTLYEKPEADELTGPVLVLTEERTVTHPEHGNVIMPPGDGCYGITYQRDLDREERLRRVRD